MKSDRRANRAASYAKRFAAKEACSKALGTGFRRGVFWRDLGVVNLKSGKPTMALTGGAKERLGALIPEGMAPELISRSQMIFRSRRPWSLSRRYLSNLQWRQNKPLARLYGGAGLLSLLLNALPILIGHVFRVGDAAASHADDIWLCEIVSKISGTDTTSRAECDIAEG